MPLLRTRLRVVLFALWMGEASLGIANGLRMPDMPLHDPFILVQKDTGYYYLYTSNRAQMSGTSGVGAMAYRSKDLTTWEKPKTVFIVPSTAIAQNGGWAPEVHLYQGRYYMFITFHDESKPLADPATVPIKTYLRGTFVAVSDTPEGPFTMINEKAAVPPADFMTLDGTLYIDPSGSPWLVYAHEWIQKLDGTMEAVPLKKDLSGADGPPIHLFKGSDAPWIDATTKPDAHRVVYCTDGPELFRTRDGHLLMLWSSYKNHSYVETVARSKTGALQGPWEQLPTLVEGDSGHGMLFHTFEGQLMLVIHHPFKNARGRLYEVADKGDHLELIRERTDLDGAR